MQYLEREFGAPPPQRDEWMRHWMTGGFAALEKLLAGDLATGTFCHGEAPGLADCCLVPQVYNARRFGVDLSPFPTLARIDAACLRLPAFEDTRPEKQPDAV
jgi:maleylacetoacetate isomerase